MYDVQERGTRQSPLLRRSSLVSSRSSPFAFGDPCFKHDKPDIQHQFNKFYAKKEMKVGLDIDTVPAVLSLVSYFWMISGNGHSKSAAVAKLLSDWHAK
jgi:hypothetical protein